MKCLVFIVGLFLCSCSNTSPERKSEAYALLDDAVTVCIYNHKYLYSNMGHAKVYIPIFGDDDKPIKCNFGIGEKSEAE